MSARPLPNPQTTQVCATRLDAVLQAGDAHRKRMDAKNVHANCAPKPTAVPTIKSPVHTASKLGAAMLPGPAVQRARPASVTESIFEGLSATFGKQPPVAQSNVAAPLGEDEEDDMELIMKAVSTPSDVAVDAKISEITRMLDDAAMASSTIAETAAQARSNELSCTPEAPIQTQEVNADAAKTELSESNFQWTKTAADTQNGTLSSDGRCFAFEGTYHPMPSEAQQYACIVAGNVIGVPADKIREMDTAWLPVGFSAGSDWFVVHQDGENFWRCNDASSADA